MSILFCNAGWMERYRGQPAGEAILGGGAWVKKNEHGLEVCNFLDHEGTIYGFVKPPGDAIDIKRIAQNGMQNTVNRDTESIEGVLIVWTAPLRGHAPTVVVGWYRDATVYQYCQKFRRPPPEHTRNRVDQYRFTTNSENAVLLPVDARTHEIPRFQKGMMGQANIWYADTPEAKPVVKEVRKLVQRGAPRRSARSGNTDPEHNAKVEKAAVKVVSDHYSRLGRVVDSVEADNLGWDLEARFGDSDCLKIEVKGLSGPEPRIGLTPNEYDMFRRNAAHYRLAIVTCALSASPKLQICQFSAEMGKWVIEGQNGCEVEIERRTSAMVLVSGESCL